MRETEDSKNFARLKEENRALQQENKDLKKLVNSRRFRAASRMALAFNKVFPETSRRRKIATSAAKSTLKIYNFFASRTDRKYQYRIKKTVGRRPVIIYDSIPWDADLKQRPHHMALELSKFDYVVVYLERMGANRYKEINRNLIVINNISLLHGLKNAREKFLFISSTNANRDIYKLAKKILGRDMKLIYEFIDEINDDISPMMHELQIFYNNLKTYSPLLVLASSKKLLQDLIDDGFTEQRLLLSENAVNIRDFNFTQISPNTPSDIKRIQKANLPIVGYYGALAPWLDAKMMNEIAKKRKDLSFVYIGPDYGGGKKHFKKLSNTFFLGPKNYNQLPDYALNFDCAIIPFVQGQIAKATSPVKLFEYMAMGLPTVCTRDLEECKGYGYVYISKDTCDFEKNIDKAINDKKNRPARKTLLKQAECNTWEQRAKDIINFLNKKHERINE